MNSDDNDNNMPHWPSPPASSGSGCSPSGSFSSAQGRSSWWSVIIINREGGRWEPCGILPVVRLNVLLVVDGAHVHVVRCDDYLLEGKVIVVIGVRMIIFIAIMIMILSLYLVAAEFWPEGFLNRSLRSLCCRSQPGFNDYYHDDNYHDAVAKNSLSPNQKDQTPAHLSFSSSSQRCQKS